MLNGQFFIMSSNVSAIKKQQTKHYEQPQSNQEHLRKMLTKLSDTPNKEAS